MLHDHVERQNPLETASDEPRHSQTIDKHQENENKDGNENEREEIFHTNKEHRNTSENCYVTKTLRMRYSEDGLLNSDRSRDNIQLDTKSCKGKRDFSSTELSRGSRSWPFVSFRNNSSYISLKAHLKSRSQTESSRDYNNAFHERRQNESEALIENEIKRNASKNAESVPRSASSTDRVGSPDCSGISLTFVPSKIGEWMLVDLDYQCYEIAEAERVAIVRSNYREKKWRCSII